MPGFGSGPFGDSAFGQFNWSRRVLFETAPEIYRTLDADNDDLFRKYADAQGQSFDNLRAKIRSFADLRDPRAVRTRYDETTILRLGRVERVKGPVEQQGVLATVEAGRIFTARRARFTFADVGKELTVTNSAIATNNQSVLVTNIVSSKEVLTNPPLSVDTGPLRWELRALEASTQLQTRVQVVAGDVEPITPGWILTDGFADFTVLAREQFKTAENERKLLTLREGSDGTIGTTLRFFSPSLALTSRDVGRRLTISNTIYPETNGGKFEIVDVLSASECILDSTELVAETTGELVWALLRDPELTLQGSATLRGATEQEGEDGEVTATGTPSTFEAVSGAFTSEDVGKLLTIHKPGDVSNGTYEVLAYVSSTEIQVDSVPALGTTYHWELRAYTEVGDETQVEVRAPNLIQYLAQDFGVELDNREVEEWQRRWVESVSRWIGLKGHENGYLYIAELTGFDAAVQGLYRVSQPIYEAAVAAGADAWAVGESTTGRYGTDGSLNVVGGLVRFSSPTATFENWDVGRQIEVTGTSGATNDGLRTIIQVVDAITVEFRPVDTMTGAADANNGAITWRIVRLYSEQAPTLPVYDEINQSLMTYLKTPAVFTVDKYCWEQSPSPWSTLLGPGSAGDGVIFITAVSPTGASAFPATYTVDGRGDFEVVTDLGVGRWRLTDSGAAEHYLETAPVLVAETSGADGQLSAPRRFTSASATFVATDVGKRLTITGSAAGNDRTFVIDSFVDANNVDLSPYNSPVTPDAASGSLGWTMSYYQFEVVATEAPATGAASLEYLCSELQTCDYCRSNKVLIEATTPYLLEKGLERLRDRIAQVTPKHVEIVENYGVEASASLSLTATVDSP